jgi:hypothetical protein
MVMPSALATIPAGKLDVMASARVEAKVPADMIPTVKAASKTHFRITSSFVAPGDPRSDWRVFEKPTDLPRTE